MKISIFVDGIWACDGELTDGLLYNCSAHFGYDQDESDNVYELIEEAIEEENDHIEIQLVHSDEPVTISWTIEDTI